MKKIKLYTLTKLKKLAEEFLEEEISPYSQNGARAILITSYKDKGRPRRYSGFLAWLKERENYECGWCGTKIDNNEIGGYDDNDNIICIDCYDDYLSNCDGGYEQGEL